MKLSRLRYRLRKLREQGEEHLEEGGELNLVPYLDIIMNIIMFLLATVTFSVTLGHINVNVPTAKVAPGPSEPQKPELNLTVSITERGYTLATSGAVLNRNFQLTPEGLVQTTSELPTLPLVNGKYDVVGLSQALARIKERYPTEDRALLAATPQITYERIVEAMDAMRDYQGKVLFPGVLLVAGVN